MKGQYVYFKCLSNGVTWNFSRGPLPNNTIVERHNLFIRGVSDINVGVYECEGTTTEAHLRTGHPVTVYSRSTLQIAGNNMLFTSPPPPPK